MSEADPRKHGSFAVQDWLRSAGDRYITHKTPIPRWRWRIPARPSVENQHPLPPHTYGHERRVNISPCALAPPNPPFLASPPSYPGREGRNMFPPSLARRDAIHIRIQLFFEGNVGNPGIPGNAGNAGNTGSFGRVIAVWCHARCSWNESKSSKPPSSCAYCVSLSPAWS